MEEGIPEGIMAAAAIKYAQVRSGNYKFFVPVRICPSPSFEVSRRLSVCTQITFLKGLKQHVAWKTTQLSVTQHIKRSLCQYPVIDIQVPVPYFNNEAKEKK